MSKRKRKASDYSEEFLPAWELAARGELEIKFPSRGAAYNFRQQMHMFRKAIVDESAGGVNPFPHWWNHDLEVVEEFDQANGVGATGFWLLKCTKLGWKEQIREQAKALGDLSLPLPQSPTPSAEAPAPTQDVQEEALKKLGFNT